VGPETEKVTRVVTIDTLAQPITTTYIYYPSFLPFTYQKWKQNLNLLSFSDALQNCSSITDSPTKPRYL